MASVMNRAALFVSRVLFSAITPLLLMPRIGNRRVTRSLVSFFFGRLYGNRYPDVIASFGGRYDLAMAEGLAEAKQRAGREIVLAADCGTGTGYVTRQASEYFPRAVFLAFDLLPGMLRQARGNCRPISGRVLHVLADTFSLPLADESVDLVLVQNTMPCFAEFSRVCRPGGMVLYVDSSAGWIADVAQKLVRKQGLFGSVTSRKVDMGFYLLAQKAGTSGKTCGIQPSGGKDILLRMLRCPVDKTRLSGKGDILCCGQGHEYPVHDEFPAMLKQR